MKNARTTFASVMTSFVLLVLFSPAVAQNDTADESANSSDEEATGAPTDQLLPETVVTESRVEQPISETTRSVTVLDRETIERETAISRDIGDLLGKNVPGMATSTGALTNFTQTLRGRDFLVLIDGVPITTPLRDGARDVKNISPEALEKVEVLRGGSAVYGFGATGGIIQYRTREIDAQEKHNKIQGFSSARFEFSTEEPDDSLQTTTSHGAYGQVGQFDYLLNASFSERNSFYDSEGDRIPPEPFLNQGGLADTQEWNVLAKSGYDFNDGQERIQVLFNNYDIEQDTEFVTQAGDFLAGEKAVGVPGEPDGKNMITEKTMGQLKYTNEQVLGSRLKLNSYYLDRTARFGGFPFAGSFASQSQLEAERFGTRLTINTPMAEEGGTELIWGLDTLFDETQQNVVAGPNPTGTDPVPLMETTGLAGFAELDIPFGKFADLRAGARHEEFWIDVNSYSNNTGSADYVGQFGNSPLASPNTVEGGDLDFSETLFNINGVIHLSERTDLFGGFSQGFAPSEVGRVLRREADTGDSVEDIDPEAQKVDNYEIGVRRTAGPFTGSITGFFSESDLGTRFDENLELQRNKEEIWGLETDFQYELAESWKIGNTTTIMHSYTDADNDGELDEDLPSTRVPPLKITGFLEFAPTDRFSTRLRGLFSADRSPDGVKNTVGRPAYGFPEVDSFTIFDLYATYQLNPGTLSVGVENLFNEDYFPVLSQIGNRGSTLSRGSGRTVSISYKLKW